MEQVQTTDRCYSGRISSKRPYTYMLQSAYTVIMVTMPTITTLHSAKRCVYHQTTYIIKKKLSSELTQSADLAVNMKVWIFSVVFAVSGLAVSSQTCPSDHFSAIFVATIETIVADLTATSPDPELYFFRNVLKFRHEDIVHFAEDAIYFFNDTFGLDFSTSPPTDQHELFYENAKFSPFMLSEDVSYTVTSNNWIRTGSTRSSCYRMYDGGASVTFLGEQILHGSYGGAEGKPVGPINTLVYGFYVIDVCQQSPVVIQFQSSTPFRVEPVDGILVINLDLYNRVLGYGKAQGMGFVTPARYQSDKYHVSVRNVLTFPINT